MSSELEKFKKLALEERRTIFTKTTDQYPDMVPVLIEDNTKRINLTKSRFMVKRNSTVFNLTVQVRKELKVPVEIAIFFYTNNRIVVNDALMQNVYEENKSQDGFLYLRIRDVDSFGN